MRGYTANRAVSADQKRLLKAMSKEPPLILIVASLQSCSRLPPTSGVCLDLGTGILVSLVVDLDPITAKMGTGTTGHPYHVLPAPCYVICLGCLFEIEIQLS